MSNYSNNPLLTANDEEYIMLLEVCEEFEKQKIGKSAREKSGNPAEIVLRNHLLRRNFNVSMYPNVTVLGSEIKIDLLLLKGGVDPYQKTFTSESVKMALEVRNSGVGSKTLENGKQLNPNKVLRFKFNELEAITNLKNFAVVVLSETLLPPRGPFKWRFKEKLIGKENLKVFTLVARGLYPRGGLYVRSNLVEMFESGQMRKTGEFDRMISYLQNL